MYGRLSHIADLALTGMVTNPARGQLNREIEISLSPFAPEKLASQDKFDCPVSRQPAHSPHAGWRLS